MQKKLKVTSIAQLKSYSTGGQIVELPPFAEGQPFVARLKRPSMMGLVRFGKIPNKLLVRANELFNRNDRDSVGFDNDDEALISDMFDIFDIICRESFVEPTYEELESAGVELTDAQRMFVYNYSQAGVDALESFRTVAEDGEHSCDSEVV